MSPGLLRPTIGRAARCGARRDALRFTGNRLSKTHRGFTLLELLVVMVILGLLAAYVGPRYFAQVGKSEQGLAKAQIESFFKALDAYRLDVGAYPGTEEGLQALVSAPAGLANPSKWNGPYLQKGVPADPWGRPYIYRTPGAKRDFEIFSLGKDGLPGGTGDAADVSSE